MQSEGIRVANNGVKVALHVGVHGHVCSHWQSVEEKNMRTCANWPVCLLNSISIFCSLFTLGHFLVCICVMWLRFYRIKFYSLVPEIRVHTVT